MADKTNRYQVCTLDVDDSNEVNDVRATSDHITLPESFTYGEVRKELIAVERMSSTNREPIKVVEDGDDYYVCNGKTNKKVYLLRKVNS